MPTASHPRRLPRLIRRLVILPGILLLCVVVIAQALADYLILSPNRETIDPGKARRELISVNGRNVECWVVRSPGAASREPEAFVLFFVGKGDRADRWIGAVARAWDKRPVEVWGMNYPGSGGSDGPARLARVGPDSLAAFDAVKRAAGRRPVFIWAGSFGTTAALHVAAHRPVDGLFLQNPPPLRQLILGSYGLWNLWLLAGPAALQIPSDLDSVANAHEATAPVVFTLSGADEVIPDRYHRMVVDAYAGPKRVIEMPGARHDDPLTREAAQQFNEGIDWVWKTAMEKSR